MKLLIIGTLVIATLSWLGYHLMGFAPHECRVCHRKRREVDMDTYLSPAEPQESWIICPTCVVELKRRVPDAYCARRCAHPESR